MPPADHKCLADAFAADRRGLGLPNPVVDELETVYLPIARWIHSLARVAERPVILGVNGAQGVGKTTFCALLGGLLKRGFDCAAATLSLDDLYLSRDERSKFAEAVHPLCAVRGVPGTHDVELGLTVFDALTGAAPETETLLPRFDKMTDDRASIDGFARWMGRPDVVLFEGWCVGARAGPSWEEPFNAREARDDPQGVWSRWSAEKLATDYPALFSRIDALLMIQMPSMDFVLESRCRQERELRARAQVEPARTKERRLMSREDLGEFVALFERLTVFMSTDLPPRADVLIGCSEDHVYRLLRSPTLAEPLL